VLKTPESRFVGPQRPFGAGLKPFIGFALKNRSSLQKGLDLPPILNKDGEPLIKIAMFASQIESMPQERKESIRSYVATKPFR